MEKTFLFVLTAMVICCLSSCDKKNEPSNDSTNIVNLEAKFSVSAANQVQFSPGNLQYDINNKVYKFASKQYEFIGENANATALINNSGIIDIFCWGTGDDPTVDITLDNMYDYIDFVDWGKNAISNGGNTKNIWRTMSQEQWTYLFHKRENAQKLFGLGTVNGVCGVIILPDNWSQPSDVRFIASTTKGLTQLIEKSEPYYNNEDENNFAHNTYTPQEWSKMEATGAIFLPAVFRELFEGYEESTGYYWSSTSIDEWSAHYINFDNREMNTVDGKDKSRRRSVRLVKYIY